MVLLLRRKSKVNNKLMIVAHPDDEVLFGGSQLITEKNWKVVCVTNGNNTTRSFEFGSVMKLLNLDYEIWDYPDYQFQEFDQDVLEKDLLKIINEKNWDKIVTHNSYGEYGHTHHKQLNRLIKQLVRTKNLWTFNYHKSKQLPDDVWQKKLELIQIYQSQKEICDDFIFGKEPDYKNYSHYKIRNEIISKENLFI